MLDDSNWVHPERHIYESRITVMIDGELCSSVVHTPGDLALEKMDDPNFRDFLMHRLKYNICHYITEKVTEGMQEVQTRILSGES